MSEARSRSAPGLPARRRAAWRQSVCSRLRGRAVDAGERQQARRRARGALAPAAPRRPRPPRAARRTTAGSRAAARRGCRACRSRSRRRCAAARCARRPGPSRRAPSARSPPAAPRTRRRTARRGALRPRRSRDGSPPAASSGNVSSRLPRSPFGSIAMTGTPSMAASSISDRQRPVLPLPVMPTQTAWVTRSRES